MDIVEGLVVCGEIAQVVPLDHLILKYIYLAKSEPPLHVPTLTQLYAEPVEISQIEADRRTVLTVRLESHIEWQWSISKQTADL